MKKIIYYTQLIFVKPGWEKEFHAFQDKVLPLLMNHNGALIYRIRPDKSAFVVSNWEQPYEIHLLSFASEADFESYANDPNRIQAIALKNNSVEKMILIEGFEL